MTNSYYPQLLSLLESRDSARNRYGVLQFLLKRFCYEQTHEASELFSNLYSRIAYLCQQHHLTPTVVNEFNQIRITIRQQLERGSDDGVEWSALIKRIANMVELITHEEQPAQLQALTTPHTTHHTVLKGERWQSVRATLVSIEPADIRVTLHNHPSPTPLHLEVREHHEHQLFAHTLGCLCEGMQLNLVDVTYSAPHDTLYAEIVVIEPDFLMDISTIAECFKEYGRHPLNLLVARLQPDENTRHLLLGNIANLFLDELVNETAEHPATYAECMRAAFQQNPLSIAACGDLESSTTEREFFANCQQQFEQLKQVVEESFDHHHIARNHALLEPSFICEKLGIQGRLDLLAEDFSAFIELKSGKAKERAGSTQISHKENHYVQMMLYYAILHYSLGVNSQEVRAFLLYSRYPQLYQMAPYFGLVKQAIDLRNRMVAIEYAIQERNNPSYTLRILQAVSPQRLNEQQLDNRLWHAYYCKPIELLQRNLYTLSAIERDYIAALYTFISREQYLAKVGDGDLHSSHGASSLWRESSVEKLEAGEMISPMRLVANRVEEGNQQLQFELPRRSDGIVPNFRVGDMVLLYLKEREEQHACNQQVFKGNIEQLDGNHATIRLRHIQRNPNLLTPHSHYALEHDYSDTSFTLMYRGIGYLLRANKERRELLLGGRRASFNPALLADSYESKLEEIVAHAMAATDYYLLVGPPGTGKTSQALRLMVEHHLALPQSNILLVAYTNKAVDEICHTLERIAPTVEYLRIGQESACDEPFKKRLLPRVMEQCRHRNQVNQQLESFRIVVATLTTLSSRMDLFRLKQFDVAIVDEASQILEPQLLGLLCAKSSSGENAIGKFILIGDHKQLPAIVLQGERDTAVSSPELQAIGVENLRHSLFERLLRYEQRQPQGSPLYGTLELQGRMHPEVAAFAAQHFYGGRLHPIPLHHQCEPLPPVLLPYPPMAQQLLSQRIAFVATTPSLEISYKVNLEEAKRVAEIAHWIYQESQLRGEVFDPHTHLGIITPYRSQIAAIKRELEGYEVALLNQLTVDTVERFQGGQRDTILYSCCVNTPFQLPFLCNTIVEEGRVIDRKLNVALTRARKQLFILGCPTVLNQDPIYRELLASIPVVGGVD